MDVDRRKFLRSIVVAGSILPLTRLQADGFDELSSSIDADFADVSMSIEQQYAQIENEVALAYRELEAEVAQAWGHADVKLPTKKQWVDYSDDRLVRREFDFDKGVLKVEAVVSPSDSSPEIVERLTQAISQATVDTEKSLSAADSALNKATLRLATKGIDISAKEVLPDKQPILSGIVDNQAVTKVVKAGPEKKLNKKTNKETLKFTIPFTSGHYAKLAQRYAKPVLLYSKKHKVPASLVLAVMQTESAFNPRAMSHIPAYGLMQLVPKSGAMDSYRYLYGEKKLLGPDYLYSPEKNIDLGTGYLSLVFSRYLSSIDDPVSRWHCTVAAYNTGSGNVARAFGHKRVRAASKVVNKMSSQEVFDHLHKNLPYDETKHYVVKVDKARNHYKSWDKVRNVNALSK